MCSDGHIQDRQNRFQQIKKEDPKMETKKFARKSFDVEAVQVTNENMKEIAEWCKGTVETPHALSVESDPFINVRVRYPLTPRQSQAFVGDWVLYSGKGFKV